MESLALPLTRPPHPETKQEAPSECLDTGSLLCPRRRGIRSAPNALALCFEVWGLGFGVWGPGFSGDSEIAV